MLSDERPAWLVRIRRSVDRMPVGAGVYCGDSIVVTCAHVVARPGEAPSPITAYVEFQYIRHDQPIAATVVPGSWFPPPAGDVAVLLLADVPNAAVGAPFGRMHSGVSDHRFRAHGYPSGHERDGVLATGTVVGFAGPDLQLRADSGFGYALESGFSGTPVWDVDTAQVIGIVVARDLARADGTDPRTGYAIPNDALVKYWPGLPLAAASRPMDVEHLTTLLRIQRKNVRILEQQVAKSGGFPALHIVNQLDEARAEVARISRELGGGLSDD